MYNSQHILNTFTKLVERGEIDYANRYILAIIEALIHEWRVGNISSEELKNIASYLRHEITQGPNNLNPYIWEVLGILEEEVNESNIDEAFNKIRELWHEERLDKLEM